MNIAVKLNDYLCQSVQCCEHVHPLDMVHFVGGHDTEN